MAESYYAEYARAVIASYEKRSPEERTLLYDAVKDRPMNRVLDLGCGVGQELIPFLQNTNAECFGIDVGPELGRIAPEFLESNGIAERYNLVRAKGEQIPFADNSFDVILCRVALPYMDNRRAIAEISRVLAGGGTLLLKTHSPRFFFRMLRERAATMSAKQVLYPILCLTGGAVAIATGKHPASEIFAGKEVFQTRGSVEREFAKHGLSIAAELSDSNPLTPSYVIRS